MNCAKIPESGSRSRSGPESNQLLLVIHSISHSLIHSSWKI